MSSFSTSEAFAILKIAPGRGEEEEKDGERAKIKQ